MFNWFKKTRQSIKNPKGLDEKRAAIARKREVASKILNDAVEVKEVKAPRMTMIHEANKPQFI